MLPTRENFNLQWLCCAGNPVAAEREEYDDSMWQKVDLPHDWSIGQSFDRHLTYGDQHAYLPNATVWYRKHFRYEPQKQEQIILQFDGVYRSPDLFVNGRHVLKRFNGYLGFEAIITGYLKAGDNVIALRADNSAEQSSRWYTGSGINRNVWLRRTRDAYFLRDSLKIEARADGALALSAESSRPGEIRFAIFDPAGNRCPGTDKIADPLLWSPEEPNLYRCCAELYTDGVLADTLEARFGFRSIEFSPEHGLIFNGRKLLLRGVNLHEELCGLGTAVFGDGIRRRYRKLKEWGVNAVRLAHHPFAPEWYELADEMGLLVFAEAFDKWSGQYNGHQVNFATTWRHDLAEFIRNCRNHPSIFLWSVGNEVVEQQLGGCNRRGVTQYRKMRDEVLRHDSTRKVSCALYPARRGNVFWDDPRFATSEIEPLAFETDVVSVNYMGQFFTGDHRRHPEMVFLVSEENTADFGARWLLFDHQIGCGCFFWGGFDYLGEAPWPHKNWFRGLMDRTGNRKELSYRVEALWSTNPVVRIAVAPDRQIDSVEWNSVKLDWETLVSHWNWQPGQYCRLVLFGNCRSLTLALNGETVLERELTEADGCCVKCEIPYAPGELKLTGYDARGNAVAAHVLQTAGTPAALRHTVRTGTELTHIEFTVADDAGVGCFISGKIGSNAAGEGNAPPEELIHLDVRGNGVLAGVANSDTASPQKFSSDAVAVAGGKALAVIRRSGPGTIRVTAELETNTGLLRTSIDL